MQEGTTEQHLAETDAEVTAMVGCIWDRLLMNHVVAVDYYTLAVAMQMTPRPEGRDWFTKTRSRLEELQKKV